MICTCEDNRVGGSGAIDHIVRQETGKHSEAVRWVGEETDWPSWQVADPWSMQMWEKWSREAQFKSRKVMWDITAKTNWRIRQKLAGTFRASTIYPQKKKKKSLTFKWFVRDVLGGPDECYFFWSSQIKHDAICNAVLLLSKLFGTRLSLSCGKCHTSVIPRWLNEELILTCII